jgi:hypothetical protein
MRTSGGVRTTLPFIEVEECEASARSATTASEYAKGRASVADSESSGVFLGLPKRGKLGSCERVGKIIQNSAIPAGHYPI